ncbi:hypothetical protein N0V82_007385 [Gnomoniopsis sp. IMI 355080]|nr:hypothetical protein N0V82_007385 [Gnomoniopsis sp. IMI 355080]
MASLSTLLPLALLTTLASATSYTISKTYDSTNFFTDFDFFSTADPTHGFVTYQTQSAAESLGLAKVVNGNQVYIGVDNSTTLGQNSTGMPSVRLQSQATYNKMLLVADVAHMPFACGAWPSLWTWADPWPTKGEIDIIEGVNSQTTNAMTLHTSATCQVTQGTQLSTSTFVTGTDCNAPGTGSTGCQQQGASTASYGAGFNEAGGGVYVMEWTSSAISMWFLSRSSIPSSLGGDTLDVSVLGTPLVQFVSNADAGGCDFDQRFADHKITIDTTFCGDWAGSQDTWTADATCSAKSSSCKSWVKEAGPEEWSEVYWLFNSIKVYTSG